MTTYSKTNIVIPVGNGDLQLRLRDINNAIKFTYYHNSITAIYVDKNLVRIKTESDNNIHILDFLNPIEAVQAKILIENANAVIKNNYKLTQVSLGSTENKTIFSIPNGNLAIGQTLFTLINPIAVKSVYFNGLFINGYTFISSSGNVQLNISDIGYSVNEIDDVITIIWF